MWLAWGNSGVVGGDSLWGVRAYEEKHPEACRVLFFDLDSASVLCCSLMLG